MYDVTTATKVKRRLLTGVLALFVLSGLAACDLPFTEPGSCSCAPQQPPTVVAN